MIDGIEPAKCVQLATQTCQSIQPILRIAITASRVCADARDSCSEPLRDLDVAAFSLPPSQRVAIFLLVSSNQFLCRSETERIKLGHCEMRVRSFTVM